MRRIASGSSLPWPHLVILTVIVDPDAVARHPHYNLLVLLQVFDVPYKVVRLYYGGEDR